MVGGAKSTGHALNCGRKAADASRSNVVSTVTLSAHPVGMACNAHWCLSVLVMAHAHWHSSRVFFSGARRFRCAPLWRTCGRSCSTSSTLFHENRKQKDRHHSKGILAWRSRGLPFCVKLKFVSISSLSEPFLILRSLRPKWLEGW